MYHYVLNTCWCWYLYPTFPLANRPLRSTLDVLYTLALVKGICCLSSPFYSPCLLVIMSECPLCSFPSCVSIGLKQTIVSNLVSAAFRMTNTGLNFGEYFSCHEMRKTSLYCSYNSRLIQGKAFRVNGAVTCCRSAAGQTGSGWCSLFSMNQLRLSAEEMTSLWEAAEAAVWCPSQSSPVLTITVIHVNPHNSCAVVRLLPWIEAGFEWVKDLVGLCNTTAPCFL